MLEVKVQPSNIITCAGAEGQAHEHARRKAWGGLGETREGGAGGGDGVHIRAEVHGMRMRRM
eukprot:4558786-Pyramimonas_sp.AAC.1